MFGPPSRLVSTNRANPTAVGEARGSRSLFSRIARRGAGRRQRFARQARAAVLTLSFSALLLGSALANTEFDVPNGTTSLNTLGATSTTDLDFTNITYSPAAFTATSTLSLGTLDDLDATQTLAITGAGTITLSGGSNTVAPSAADLLYVVSGGSLSIANAVALSTSLAAGNFDVAGTATLSGMLSGGSTGAVFTKTGAGTLALSNSGDTFAGGLTISGGTLSVLSYPQQGVVTGGNGAYYSQNGTLGTGLVTVNTGSSLYFNPGSNLSNQFYSNSFNLNGGTINAYDAETRLGGTVTTSGGTVTSYGAAAGSTINVGANGGVLVTNYSGKDLFVDGQLTGSGALRISSAQTGYSGTVHLDNGTNTYSGTLTVATSQTGFYDGALEIDNGTALQNATLSLYTVRGVTFGSSVTNATIGALAGSSSSSTLGLTLPSGTLTVGGNNTSSTFAALLLNSTTSGANSALVKTGTGTLTLLENANSYSNTFSGGLTISGGTLIDGESAYGGTLSAAVGSGYYGQNGLLGTGTVTVNSGATLSLSPGSTSNHQYYANSFVLNGGTIIGVDGLNQLGDTVTASGGTATAVTPTGTITIGAGGGTLLSIYGGKDTYVDGVLAGSGALTVDNSTNQYGAASVHITNAANTYSGTLTINPATSSANTGGSVYLDNNTALQNAGVNLLTVGTRPVTSGGGTTYGLSFGTGVTAPVLGALAGTGTIFLNVQNTSSNAAVALTVGGNNASTTYTGALIGSGSLTKTGTGTLTLGGANTFSGTTTISAGTLAFGPTTGTSIGYTSIIGGSGTLAFTGAGTTTISNTETLTGPVVVNAGTALLTSPNSITGAFGTASSITINNGGTLSVGGDNALTGNTGAATTPTIINAGGVLTTNSTSRSSHLGPITLAGGTLASLATPSTITGNGTYYGTYNIDQPITVNGGTNTSVISAAGVTFDNSAASINVASGAANGIDLDVTGTFIHPTQGSDSGLTKTGAGVMRLSNATGNTYTSNTTVSAGTLLVTNTSGSATGTGAVMVASGATLGGTGIITGATTVRGTLAPGPTAVIGQVGTLTTGALTLASTTNALFDVDGASNFDKAVVNGAVAYAGTLTIDLGSYAPASGTTFQLFNATGAPSGAFTDAAAVAFDQAGYTGTFDPTSGTLTINATAVPEPATWLAGVLCMGVGAGIYSRRRHGRAASV